MIGTLLITLLLVLCCVAIHVQVLVWLRQHTVSWNRRPTVKLGFIVFMLLITHIIEIMMFAGVFYGLIKSGDFGGLAGSRIEALRSAGQDGLVNPFDEVVYFSFATYTTVGYGDVTPVGPMQVLAQVEALTGLLLVGCSASLVFTFLQEFLALHRKKHS